MGNDAFAPSPDLGLGAVAHSSATVLILDARQAQALWYESAIRSEKQQSEKWLGKVSFCLYISARSGTISNKLNGIRRKRHAY